MEIPESMKGKVVLNLYPAVLENGELVIDRGCGPRRKIVDGADSEQYREEDWIRMPNGEREFVSDKVFSIVGGQLIPVEES